MSVDVKAHVDIQGRIIQIYIQSHDLVESVKILNPTVDLDYQSLYVKMKNDYDRIVHVHHHSGLFGSTLVTTRSHGDMPVVLEDMVRKFSGIYDHNDCDDKTDLVVIKEEAEYSEGNTVFVLKWAIAKGYISGTSQEDVEQAFFKFNEDIGK